MNKKPTAAAPSTKGLKKKKTKKSVSKKRNPTDKIEDNGDLNRADSSMSIDDDFVSPTGDLGPDEDDTDNGTYRP